MATPIDIDSLEGRRMPRHVCVGDTYASDLRAIDGVWHARTCTENVRILEADRERIAAEGAARVLAIAKERDALKATLQKVEVDLRDARIDREKEHSLWEQARHRAASLETERDAGIRREASLNAMADEWAKKARDRLSRLHELESQINASKLALKMGENSELLRRVERADAEAERLKVELGRTKKLLGYPTPSSESEWREVAVRLGCSNEGSGVLPPAPLVPDAVYGGTWCDACNAFVHGAQKAGSGPAGYYYCPECGGQTRILKAAPSETGRAK